MDVARVEAVSLDLFGTLLDFSIERDETPLVKDLLEEAGVDRDAGEVLDAWVRASLAERGKTPFRTVRESLVVGARVVDEGFGLGIDPWGWALALEELWVSVPLRGDALEGLERLEASGLAWGVVTNLDACVLERVLEASGLSEWVKVGVCSEDARAYKPHPRPFWMLADRLGFKPGGFVHVGDAAGEDRAGARAAGFMGCRLVGEEGFVGAVDGVLG